MKSNFSFKFFACVVLFVFLSVFAGGCGGGSNSSTNGNTPTTLEDVFEDSATVTVGFIFFGEEAYATFKHEGDEYLLVEKGGNFADNFTNANAWREDNNFIVQIYLVPGWNLAMASDTSLPADDVWEIEFSSKNNTYKDRVRTGVFANNLEDFQVNSVIIDEVEIIDQLEPLPYEEPIEEPEAPSNDDSINGGNNGGSGGGNPPAPTPSTVITLTSRDIALGIGQNATLVATVTPTATVTWSTTNPTVATVENGVVTGVSAGTATITATAGGKSTTCNVTVGVVYLSRSYDEATHQVVTETKAAVEYELVTASTTEFTDGKYYVVSGDVTIDASSGSCITTKGTAHLILCDGATLTAGKAIDVSDGSNSSFTGTLHIYAQSDANAGNLVATGTHASSGIGGGSSNGGTLYIHGGVITATGGNSGGAGAGIGGGSKYKGGNVYIYGGTITATGGSYNNNNGTIEAAAGIGGGGGIYGTDVGDGGNVYIYGGTVTATGGYVAPSAFNSSPVIGKGIGAGNASTVQGNLTVGAGLTVLHESGQTYVPYDSTDYSTRYQYMKVEPSDGTRQH